MSSTSNIQDPGAKKHAADLPAPPPEVLAEFAAENNAEREAMLRAWYAAGDLLEDRSQEPDLERISNEIWGNLQAAINEQPEKPYLRLVKSTSVQWISIAAAIVVLVAFGASLWFKPVTVQVPYGKLATIELPDGSLVELNSGSSITYPRIFGNKQRQVHLTGEAFFDVKKEGRPFIATTFNASVTVLGTQFNVRAWPEKGESFTEVVLASGSVELSPLKLKKEKVLISPGQRARVVNISSSPTPPVTAEIEDALAWRDQRVVAFGETIGSIFRRLERRFAVSIEADADNLLNTPHSITYGSEDGPELILKDLCEQWNCRVQSVKDGFKVSMNE